VSWNLRIRLSLMMFLEFAIWGAWAPVLWPYLVGPVEKGCLGFSAIQASQIYGVLWLACIAAPFIGGQIVDRWFPTQWFLAAVHLVGGALMLWMTKQKTFGGMWLVMMIYSLLYAPTLALTASLCFHHLADPDKQFGSIRVFGTIGWIVAGWGLTVWRSVVAEHAYPADMLLLAGYASFAMGVLCLLLPHTPPKKEAANPWAFLEALRLLKNPQFLIFMVISFVVTTELQFYYLPTAEFLEKGVGIQHKNVPMVMTTAQIAEMIAMGFFMGLALKAIGVRKSLAIGVIAWPLRYVIFAVYQWVPWWVVVASLALHGIGYTFFFTVSQVYVDRVAPSDIRASAQALLTIVTLGLGNYLGTVFTGFVMKWLSTFKEVTKVVGGETVTTVEVASRNWLGIFLVPCALTVLCAIAFLAFFKEPPARTEAQAEPQQQPAD